MSFTTAIFAQHTFVYENFDANNGSWTSSTRSGPHNGSWTYHTTTTPLQAEAGYWALNSFNSYGDNYYTYLTSPAYSTSGYTSVKLRLDIFHDTDNDVDDGMQVEYSYNGSAWFQLGTTSSTGLNWYNDTDIDAISNNAHGWSGASFQNASSASKFIETSVVDSAMDNRTTIYFRIVFASDDEDADMGVAIDNFFLEGTPSTTIPITVAPGGRTTDLELWLKANDGVTTTDNTDISTWTDQAGDDNAIAYSTFLPTYKDNATDNVNYNPIIDFDRTTQDHMKGKGGYHSQDYFLVLSPTEPIDNTGTYRQQPIAGKFNDTGFSVDGTGTGFGFISGRYTNALIAHTISSYPNSGPPTPDSYGRCFSSSTETIDKNVMILNIKTNSSDTSTEIYLNGEQVDNQTGLAGDGNPLIFSEFDNLMYYLGVGRFTMNGFNPSVNSYYDGGMSELISYSSKGSNTEQDRILSYLAIKNGVTLKAGSTSTTSDREGDRSYYASNGTTIWDHTSDSGDYNHDITGIGRDDNTGLNQKQSRTQNDEDDVTISLGGIYDTNSNNPNTFDNDRDFLVWGNNGDNIVISSPTINTVDLDGTTTNYIMADRRWRIQETTTGDIGNVFISIPASFLQAAHTLAADEEYALIVAANGAFGPADIVDILPFDVNGTDLEIWYDFDNIRYFTIGVAERAEGSYGLDFGSGDYLVSNDDIDLNSDFTISAWVKKVGAGGTVFAKDDDYRISVSAGGTVNVAWNGVTQLAGTVNINGDRWHHISVVKSGSAAALYIDGFLDVSGTVTAPLAGTSNFFSVGVVWADKNNISNSFTGDIDELHIWDEALTLDQLRYLMNQEIEEVSGNVEGKIIPTSITKNDLSGELWSHLLVYYDFNSYYGTSVKDKSNNDHWARIKYLTPDKRVVTSQTAPLPYVSAANGNWETSSTWANGSTQIIPASSFGGTDIDWNIIEIRHNVTTGSSKEVLALMNTANTLTINDGNALTVSHYLELDGKIDLQGEAQLIQETDSDLDVTSSGTIERDQQGTLDKFTYNYWSSPVGAPNNSTNNNSYQIQNVLKDGSDPNNPQNITWTSSNDGSATSPITLSHRWIYRFVDGTADDYYSWLYTGQSGTVDAGEGFSMKGPGTGVNLEQNYTFDGKPNNGVINLSITGGNQYLIGNPYPSAIDATTFINDNLSVLDGTLQFWHHWGGGSHVTQEYQGGYGYRNALDGIAAVSWDGSGVTGKRPERYIPVSQGFFVEAASGGMIEFNNSQRAFETEGGGSSLFIRGASQERSAEEEDTRMKIWLSAKSEETDYSRQILLGFDEKATDLIDRGLDSKITDENENDLYWTLGDDKLVIQTLPQWNQALRVPLGVVSEADGMVTFKIDELAHVPADVGIYISDLKTGQVFNLREGNFQTPVTAGVTHGRFSIRFQDELTLGNDSFEQLDGLSVSMSSDASEVVVLNKNARSIQQVSIHNVFGQRIFNSTEATSDTQMNIALGDSAGMYIVKVVTEEGELTRKVFKK